MFSGFDRFVSALEQVTGALIPCSVLEPASEALMLSSYIAHASGLKHLSPRSSGWVLLCQCVSTVLIMHRCLHILRTQTVKIYKKYT